MSTQTVPNTTHLFGHLRSEFPLVGDLRVQVRNVDKPKRRFLVVLTNGSNFIDLSAGGFTTQAKAKEFVREYVR